MRVDVAMALDGVAPSPEPDEVSLVRAAQRDAAGFAPLYRLHVARVYRYIRTRTANEQDAMDLTQAVFLRALDALPRYRPASAPFSAWLFRIARNAVIDHHRRSRITIPLETLPESLHPVAGDNPAEAAVTAEGVARLRAGLETLDPARRELLALRFAAGLTIKEIAAVLGKPEPTVKSNLRRTLIRLKEYCHDK